MSLDVVLVLRADAQKLKTLFELPAEGDGFTASPATPGVRIRPLADGALVRTRHAFGMDHDELLTALRAELGRALALHDDPRGLFIAPSVAELGGATVDEVIDEVAEGGEWLALEARRKSPSVSELLGAGAPMGAMPDLGALLGGAGGQGGLPDLGQIANQMGIALPEGALAQVTGMLQGEGGAALMQAAAQLAQGLSGEDLSRIAAGDVSGVAGKAELLAQQMGLAAPDADAVEAAQQAPDGDEGEG